MTPHHKAHAEQGSVLPPDAAAVTVDAEGNFGLLLPHLPPDAEVPRGVLLLVAVLTRSSDPEWVEEMIEWFTAQARS
ncbi:MAG: hypothetical protein QJR07_04055 [Acetobacteraceae bacterium]|nr:hypothetical protein [Acetobacteraceae bacterium]